jgi:YVTN family beta-propeller protein
VKFKIVIIEAIATLLGRRRRRYPKSKRKPNVEAAMNWKSLPLTKLLLLPSSGLVVCAALTSVVFGGATNSAKSELAIDTNWADNTLSILNLQTGTEKTRIEVGAKPYDVKVDKLGRFAYTSLSGARQIAVVDLQANLAADKITVGESPRDMVFNNDFSQLVVTNSGSNSISIVDVKTKKELAQIAVGLVPYGVALADNDQTAIVSNWGEGTISFVDLKAQKEVKRVSVGHLPYTVTVMKDRSLAFTAVFGDDKVAVLDIKTQSLIREIPVGKSPWGISASESRVAVANFYSGSVSIIDLSDPKADGGYSVKTYEFRGKKPGAHIEPSPQANKPTDTTRTAAIDEIGGVDRAKHVALSADGMLLFTDLASNTVNLFNLNSNEFITSIPVGHAPYGIDFLPMTASKVTSNQ